MDEATSTETTEPTIESLTPQVVAILFAAGDPVSIRVLAKRLGTKPTQLREVVDQLGETLRSLGLAIARDDTTLQLVTAPEASDALVEWGKEIQESPLSPAAVETMSVIAYLDGATKAEIDFIRGVNSTITLRLF
jgi:segregation and condensation protein B